MTHLQRVESALLAGNPQLANDLLGNLAGDPERIYYELIRDGLVATFRHLDSSVKQCSEWDSFRYCSNTLLELDVKNVPISDEMETLVMYKLSAYGLRRLCGSPADKDTKIDWRDSIDRVVQWVGELRQRSKCYDFLDIDDEVMYRIRMIHNHLFFVKHRPEVQGLPLRELIFCLAIFARSHYHDPENVIYRMVINKRNVMVFSVGVVSRLKSIIISNNIDKQRKSGVLKKLRKTYRRLKQMYSVNKMMGYVKVHSEFDPSDFKRDNSTITLAAFKRYNQICGEAIKNTVETPNLSAKLTKMLSKMLTEAITLNSKFRNYSTHGFPLSQLYHREADHLIFYRNLIRYINLSAELFYSITVFILIDCYRYMYGLIQRCRTNEDLCAFIRYLGNDTIRPFHKNEIEDDSVLTKAFKDLLDTYCNLLMEVQMMAFANAPIKAIRCHLYTKLTNKSILDVLIAEQKIPLPQDVSKQQYNVQRQMELNRESSEQWHYREKTRQILNHFTDEWGLDDPTYTAMENRLHAILSRTRNGYYNNVFALDSKAQSIKESLKASSSVGPKLSNHFKIQNKHIKQKLASLRHQDEIELNETFRKIILNLQDTFKRSECDNLENFIRNHKKITLKYRLAIEYWQLQVMEILKSSGHFGDNFILLTKSIPLIWGRSYRNYLAHDSLSYDLLTSSGPLKVLINGFVLAFNLTELNIFSRSPNFELSGLVDLEIQGSEWLKLQANLLNSIKTHDRNGLLTSLNMGAELNGRHLQPLGKIMRPILYDVRMILSHDQLDQTHNDAFMFVLSSHVYNDISLAVKLNLHQISDLPIREAIEQFESLQPSLIAPCLGVVLPHIVATDNIPLLKMLIAHYFKDNTFSIHIMTISCMLLDPEYLSNIPLNNQFAVSIVQNNVTLLQDLVNNSANLASVGTEVMNTILERCSYLGRFEMVRSMLNSCMAHDQEVLSNCLQKAIDQRHWNIVNLLLSSEAAVRFDENRILQVISKQNFWLVRKMLAEPIPADSIGNIVNGVVRLGSLRLVKFLFQSGKDVFACSGILSSAMKNKNPQILEYLEERLLQSYETRSTYERIDFWINIFQNIKTLSILCLNSEFISSMVLKPYIVKRWTTRIANLMKLDTMKFVGSFHIEDVDGFFTVDFSHTTVDNRTLQKCTLFTELIQRLPENLFVIKSVTSRAINYHGTTLQTDIEFTFYSTTNDVFYPIEQIRIPDNSSLQYVDSITNAFRAFLIKFPQLKLTAAKITITNDSEKQRLFYIQSDSISCILQQSSQDQFRVPFLFNKPGQENILHNLQPDTSPAIAECLLEMGADPVHKNDRSETPFHTVLRRPVPLTLIKLMYLYYNQHRDPFQINVLNHRDLDGYTPLQAAVATNCCEVADFMLQNGADPTHANASGEAALLCHAILNRNILMTELLLRSCPSLTWKYVHGKLKTTALEMAIHVNHDHITRLLLDEGAELNHRNGENCTILKCAIEYEAVESLQVMLDFALRSRLIVDNDVDGSGMTGLEYAHKSESCKEIVRALVCYIIKQQAFKVIDFSNRCGINLSM